MSGMRLEPLTEALLRAAREDADAIRAAAEQDATARVDDARRRAEDVVDQARQEGHALADDEMGRVVARAHRDAHGIVLTARNDAVEQLREGVIEALATRRGTPSYDALLDRLEAVARRQLGPDVEIVRDVVDGGGVIATSGTRRVDYTLAALVDRCLAALGEEVTGLWT